MVDYLVKSSCGNIAFEFMKGLKEMKKSFEQNIVIESTNTIHKILKLLNVYILGHIKKLKYTYHFKMFAFSHPV